MNCPHAGNVRFSFVEPKQSLWISSDWLVGGSPYLNRLLSETPLKGKVEVDKSLVSPSNDDDQFAIKLDADLSNQPVPDVTFHSITVDSPAYTTFAAVLVWMITKYIICAQPPPVGIISDTPSPSERAKTDSPPLIDNPYSLPTLTWKSAFRAAHLFEIAALKRIALAEFKRTLTADDAARELFGPLSAAHLDVRDVAMEYVITNWDKIKDSEGMKEVEKLIKDGKVEKGAEIAIELARRR